MTSPQTFLANQPVLFFQDFFKSYPTLVRTFLALVLFSVFTVSLVPIRIAYTGGTLTFIFLCWNLFLAWVPLFAALTMLVLYQLQPNAKALMVLLGGIWLAFYPNAPYIITDLFHLKVRAGVPIWFDVIVLTSFLFSGLLAGFLSLQIVHHFVEKSRGRFIGWLFVGVISFLGGFGIYIGRYLRWNSWDVIDDLQPLMYELWTHLSQPFLHPRTYGVTVLFGVFLFLGYVVLRIGNPCLENSK